MNIKILEHKVIVDDKTFTIDLSNNRLDEHRNQVLSEVLEYLDSMEDELVKSLKDKDYQNLPLSQHITEANIFLLRSLKETIGYMKV